MKGYRVAVCIHDARVSLQLIKLEVTNVVRSTWINIAAYVIYSLDQGVGRGTSEKGCLDILSDPLIQVGLKLLKSGGCYK